MFYYYERYILEKFKEWDNKITMFSIADSIDVFNGMTDVTPYPVLIIFRMTKELTFPVDYPSTAQGISISPHPQEYVGRIYDATNIKVFEHMAKIRKMFAKDPYLRFDYPPLGCPKIALRLLGMKIDQDRNAINLKGPQKYVEFTWSSVIPVIMPFFKNFDSIHGNFTLQEDEDFNNDPNLTWFKNIQKAKL